PSIREVLNLSILFECFQMQHDRSPANKFTGFDDRKSSVARGFPLSCFVLAGTSSEESQAIGDHKCRIETHTKLSNQRAHHFRRFARAQRLQQFASAGLGYRADVRDDFLSAHADSVVADRERSSFRIALDPDLELLVRPN